MPTDPAISVVLPVHNGGRYLRAAVASVLGQTFADFELIALDDGSTDGSAGVVRSFGDARVRLVSRPNRGLVATLNEGIDLARGRYVARMDADDLCLPDRFAKQVAYLDVHPECVLLGTRVLMVDPAGLPIRELATELTHEQIDGGHLGCRWPMVHPATMMRAAAVRAVGCYRPAFDTLEDLDLFLRLAEVGRVANLPDVLLHYRQHFASVTHTRADRQRQIRQAIFDQTTTRRGQPPLPRLPPPAGGTKPRHAQHRAWAWSALQAGYLRTARKHAAATVVRAPLLADSWRVLACAVRGR